MSEGPIATVVRSVRLEARPLTELAFDPFGRSLGPGARVPLGGEGQGLASVDLWRPGGLAVGRLQRYPTTRRILLPMSDAVFAILVLAPGEAPGERLKGFHTAPGQGFLLEAGVWHAGPVVLSEGTVCEILEAPGAADRIDVAALASLVDADFASVDLPGEESAAPRPLDLGSLGSVELPSRLQGWVAAGFLHLTDVEIGEPGEDLARACADARGRMLGAPLPPLRDNLHAATLLVEANRGLRLLVCDAGLIQAPLTIRRGRSKERIRDELGRRSSVRAEPVLCDAQGILGSCRAGARRSLSTGETDQVLITVFLDPKVPVRDVKDHLDAVSRSIRAFTQGREAARVVIGLEQATP